VSQTSSNKRLHLNVILFLWYLFTQGGSTALHHAARWGHTDIIRLLVAHGAKTDTRNFKGCTPVQIASGPAKRLMRGEATSLTQEADGKAAAVRDREEDDNNVKADGACCIADSEGI
jgi:ankyrin repeat protein